MLEAVEDGTHAIGIDIGTASIRTCVTDSSGVVSVLCENPIQRQHHLQHQEFITQSSTEIWETIKSSMGQMLHQEQYRGKIKGIGVDATCSLVVLQKCNGKLVPYPVDFGFNECDQNVVLWMDHRAQRELSELNEVCKDEPFMARIGGGFLPEMGVPKLKYLVSRIPVLELSSLLFMELHDFVSIMLLTNGELEFYQSSGYMGAGADSELALDGSTKGWSEKLLRKFGLSQLSADNFKLIGRAEASTNGNIPFAGSRIGVVCESLKRELGLPLDEEIFIGHGVIDCYAGWIATVGQNLDTTLSMVAGTSTCFLIASNNDKNVVPGVWGPFNNFIKDHYISELGLSATGALIEHLFKSHPAYASLQQAATIDKITVFTKLDLLLDELADAAKVPIANLLSKHMFLYGDILGNRTPYGDPDMKGAFLGESSDLSQRDLLLKYLCILEFLALQTRQIVTSLVDGGYKIDQISMSGSQFGNKRLVKMIEVATKVKVVSLQAQKPLFTVVKGASMIGFAAALDTDIQQVMASMNSVQEVELVGTDSGVLGKILDAKYEIMTNMAETQRRYRKLIDEALQN